MSICTLKDVDIRGKRVLIREDLNVPVVEGKVVSDARIRAALRFAMLLSRARVPW